MSDKNSACPVSDDQMLCLVAEIAAAYVENTTVPIAELPELFATIHKGLSRIESKGSSAENRPEPAVPIRKSVFPDYIICLEDGKKLKMLKRHLKTSYNMTPEQYKERWGLGTDYPLVAPNYARQRSKLAKQIGLGTSRKSNRQKAA